MAFSAYLRRARALPPQTVARKAIGLVARAGIRRLTICYDYAFCTYGDDRPRRNPAASIEIRANDISPDGEAILRRIGDEYLAHRFDLLGSGWHAPTYGSHAGGFLGRRYEPNAPPEPERSGRGLDAVVGRSNLDRARACWSLIGENYRPIDWQLDFRSGYRWSARRHSYQCSIPVDTGADVKVPWELGRLQHLPQLALCAVLAAAGRGGFEPPHRYVQEIADQLLDFIATNPPRFGVNWMSTMDVAIRAANVALTLSLLQGARQMLLPAVASIIISSIKDHVRYIAKHLDYAETGRSNHYFCELAGLIWACWILEPDAERDRRLMFAIDEIEKEAAVQFLPDGGNYEGSTNYHRLSGEALLFSVGVIRALGRRVPTTMLKTLRKAADLTRALQGIDGTAVQIGDTDSGRFFKLQPTTFPPRLGASSEVFVENTLDHDGFVEGVAAIFEETGPNARLEAVITRKLIGGPLAAAGDATIGDPDFGDLDRIEAAAIESNATRRIRRLPLGRAVALGEWRRSAFPDFGLYVFRHDELLIAFRCFGSLDPAAPRGHTHDDNLAVEYRLGSVERRDPGSYVYTPSVARRNAYRAAAAHDAPRAASWAIAAPGNDLFDLDHCAYAKCLVWRPDGVAGEIRASRGRLLRIVRLTARELMISDFLDPPQALTAIVETPLATGYGRV